MRGASGAHCPLVELFWGILHHVRQKLVSLVLPLCFEIDRGTLQSFSCTCMPYGGGPKSYLESSFCHKYWGTYAAHTAIHCDT